MQLRTGAPHAWSSRVVLAVAILATLTHWTAVNGAPRTVDHNVKLVSYQNNFTAVFASALSPSLVRLSGAKGPQLLPQWQPLLTTLLSNSTFELSMRHWQGRARDQHIVLSLLGSGQEAVASSQQPALIKARKSSAFSCWLSQVELVLASLPSGPIYPFLRRCLVALLLRGWLAAEGDFSAADEAAATNILLKLHALHVSGASRKAALEYYHFSKAAGTSVCVTAAAAGCSPFSVSEQYTCLVPEFGDGPRWISRKAHAALCRREMPEAAECLTRINSKLASWGLRYSSNGPFVGCSERAAWLRQHGYNMYASEYTLRGHDGDVSGAPALCAEFLNLAVLRSPRRRLQSHLRYIVRVTYNWLGDRTAQYFKSMSLYDWHRLLPAATDNYYLRALLGEAGFYAHTGSLNASAHLPAARAALGAMDVVLLLEDPKRLSLLGHKWGLGWNSSFLQAAGRSHVDAEPDAELIADKVLPTGADARELAAANVLDEQLYGFAVLLSRLDAVVWAAVEAGLGGSPQPSRGRGLAGRGSRCGCGYVPAAAHSARSATARKKQ